MVDRKMLQDCIDQTTNYFELLQMMGFVVEQAKDEVLEPEQFSTEIKALVERLDHLITTDTLE